MQFVEILGSAGIAAITVKILDVLWLQKVISDNERTKWLRDKQLQVFSRVSGELISQKNWGVEKRPTELFELIGEATLLIENDSLAAELDSFFKDSQKPLRISNGMLQEAAEYDDDSLFEKANEFHKSEHARLQENARRLISGLKKEMLK